MLLTAFRPWKRSSLVEFILSFGKVGRQKRSLSGNLASQGLCFIGSRLTHAIPPLHQAGRSEWGRVDVEKCSSRQSVYLYGVCGKPSEETCHENAFSDDSPPCHSHSREEAFRNDKSSTATCKHLQSSSAKQTVVSNIL